LHIYSVYVNIILWRNWIRIRYSTIATKEAARNFGLGLKLVTMPYMYAVKEIRKLKSQDSRTSECLRCTAPNRISLVLQKNLKREIRWNHFDHNKQMMQVYIVKNMTRTTAMMMMMIMRWMSSQWIKWFFIILENKNTNINLHHLFIMVKMVPSPYLRIIQYLLNSTQQKKISEKLKLNTIIDILF
jgi:hypothetical protein